jgi:antitoxin component of RelBE/YafQ-DinJ toxin-antitoxin module
MARPRRATLPEGTPLSTSLEEPTHRVNVTILESQHAQLAKLGINVSALIRELLSDYLSRNTIVIRVDDDTRELYDTVVANTGATHEEVARELRPILARILDSKLERLKQLRRQLT